MKEILEQVKAMREAMNNAINLGLGESDELNEKFYNSSFSLSFDDKIAGKRHEINLFVCPEVWELFEGILADIPELLEEY